MEYYLKAKNLCRGHWQMQAVLDEDLDLADPAYDTSQWPVVTPKTGITQIR